MQSSIHRNKFQHFHQWEQMVKLANIFFWWNFSAISIVFLWSPIIIELLWYFVLCFICRYWPTTAYIISTHWLWLAWKGKALQWKLFWLWNSFPLLTWFKMHQNIFFVSMCTVETVSLHMFRQRSLKEMLQQLTAQAVAAHPRSA